MKKLNFIVLSLFFCMLIACGGRGNNGQGEKYELYYKLETGKTYNQNMAMKTVMQQDIAGQKMDMDMNMYFGMSFTVTETKNDRIHVKMGFTSIEMEMATPMGSFSFSSESESDANAMMPIDLSKMLKGMKNIGFDMVMTKYGKVEALKGYDEMIDGVLESFDLSEVQKMQARAALAQSFSEEKMIEQMKNMTIYPDYPVSIGESWTLDANTNQADLENTYTLKEINENEIVLEVNSDIKNMKIEGGSGMLDGVQQGTTTAHRSSGWIKEANIKQDVSGTVTMHGMEVSIDMKSDVTITE